MNAKPPPAVGIDLGTTFSVIAFLDPSGRPTTIANAEGDPTTPAWSASRTKASSARGR
jgi:molecular chaperone DnaK (HSP70)